MQSVEWCHRAIFNVNVNLYSAQKAPLMRSCRVLIKRHVFSVRRQTQIVLEQVLCRWSSDSEGMTAVRIELKLWNE